MVYGQTMANTGRKPGPEPEKKPKARFMDGAGNFCNLTPDLQERLINDLVSTSDWPQMVASRNGVSHSTLAKWVIKGLDSIAVEPYASFAERFVRAEAEISGRLMKVLLDAALGTAEPQLLDGGAELVSVGPPPPDVGTAKWLLLNRFRFLWQCEREAEKRFGGIAVAELVERHLLEQSVERREAAREILKTLPADAKRAARKKGFLLT